MFRKALLENKTKAISMINCCRVLLPSQTTKMINNGQSVSGKGEGPDIRRMSKGLLNHEENSYYFFLQEFLIVFSFFLESILFMGKVTDPDIQTMKGRDLDSL